MNTRNLFPFYQALITVAVASLGFLGPAHSATDWETTFSGCTSGTTYATTGNWGSCGSSTGGVSTEFAGLSWKYSGALPAAPSVITSATTANTSSVVSWGSNGLGVYALGSTSESHTVDNGGSYVDSVVLDFGKSVTMDELSIGWKGTDADITVFAWNGSAPSSVSSDPESLTGGWTMVAQIANAAEDTSITFTSTASSSYWLVAALGGDSSVDSFKLLSVAGFTGSSGGGSTPEPGSIALLGLGALGLLAARRKAQTRS